jgi:hypothetical protein
MPVRLIAADDWLPSSMTERRLLELEREGLLRPRTSSSWPEWIAPAVDHREPRPPTGYVVSCAKFHHHGLGAPPSRFMRALCHHYGVELQHFSPNTVTAVLVFAVVCEGYLGMMPHWDLWLHQYRGELFNAPGGSAGVRKPVRAGCLNLVLKTGKSERPREYIPVGLTSNHAGWDSQWFYLWNDDDLLPAYTGRGEDVSKPSIVVALSTPLLGRRGVVVRTSRSPQSCWSKAGSSRSFDREQDQVIAGTSRHELEAPEPNHRGARNR